MAKDVQYRADLMAFAEPPQTIQAPIYQDSSVDILAIARVLRRQLKVILGTGLVCLLVAAALAFTMRNRYTASTTFIPPGSSVSGASALAGQLAQLSGFGGLLGTKSSADLYLGILRSRVVLDNLISRFNLLPVYRVKTVSEAERQLVGHSDFSVGARDSIVTITFTDHDPVRARDVANAYLQELEKESGSLALSESSQRRLFFENRLSQEKNALAEAEVALKQSQEKTGLIAPAGQTANEIQAVAQLRSQIASRRVNLASLLHDETDENPDVLRLRSEISNLESQVSQMDNSRTGGPAGAISSIQVPGLELDYVRLAREVKYHETLFEIIARQYEAARLDEAHDTPLQLLDRARTPEGPSGPPRLLIMLGALFFGLFVSSLYVVVRDRFLSRSSAEAEIQPGH